MCIIIFVYFLVVLVGWCSMRTGFRFFCLFKITFDLLYTICAKYRIYCFVVRKFAATF